jgi:hypothetical protein
LLLSHDGIPRVIGGGKEGGSEGKRNGKKRRGKRMGGKERKEKER